MSIFSKLTFKRQDRYVYAVMLAAMLLLYMFVSNEPPGSIVGKWRSSDVPGAHWRYPVEMIFNSDGTGGVTVHLKTGPVSEKIRYAVRNGILTLKVVNSDIPPEVVAEMVPNVTADASIFRDKLVGGTLSLIQGNEPGYVLLREKNGEYQ